MSDAKDPNGDTIESVDNSFGILFRRNLYHMIRDILVPVRVIIATFIVFAVFLMADTLLFWMFDRLTQDIQQSSRFVVSVFDGVEILSVVGIGLYFVLSGMTNLRTQWQIAKDIERRAGLK